MRKTARGFKLMQEHQTPTSSIYLFCINGSRYLVSIHYSFFHFLIKKKNYEFDEEAVASRFFEKLIAKFWS